MILVLLAVCICICLVLTTSNSDEDFKIVMYAVFGMASLGCIVVAVVLSIECVNGQVLQRKINMYTDENIKIEEQIAAVVEDYKTYEQQTYEDLTPDNAITFATVYPELASNNLVQEQIYNYINNNNIIRSLKEEEINLSVKQWWLYFGKLN